MNKIVEKTMKVRIIRAKDVHGGGYYTHGLAKAVKLFIEDENIITNDLKIYGSKDETLIAIILYDEISERMPNER